MGKDKTGVVARRQMSIQRALEWAFKTEHANLEFDEMAETAGSSRGGVDGIWIMIQRGRLGCEVDGGGFSYPADDAESIASAVSNLPRRDVALLVADCARAGMAPDWIPDRPRLLPVDTTENQYGWRSRVAQAHLLTDGTGWPIQTRTGRKGRIIREPVYYCPCVWRPTPYEISRARAIYHTWCEALIHIAADLRATGVLSKIEITLELPDFEPWRKKRR